MAIFWMHFFNTISYTFASIKLYLSLLFSESGFVCMEVNRKSDSILSVRLGRLSRNPDEACNQHLFFDTSIKPSIIVSAKHGQREMCPLVGKYALIGQQILENNQQEQSSICKTYGNHNNQLTSADDHLTFGCAAGGATEFSLIQNNCSIGSSSASNAKTSSKWATKKWQRTLLSYSYKKELSPDARNRPRKTKSK